MESHVAQVKKQPKKTDCFGGKVKGALSVNLCSPILLKFPYSTYYTIKRISKVKKSKTHNL